MANTKISALTADTAPTADDLVVTVNDPGGTPATRKATITNFTKAIPAVIGDSGSGGTKGLVPAPGAGDAAAGKFLKADGTFAVPSVPTSGTPFEMGIACSDESTALTAGTAKVTFRMPRAVTLTAVRASLSTAQASGSIFTVDVNEAGTTILSTKITIDNTEKTSTTAATAPVISDSALADDAEITVDIDQVGDGTAKGLKVYLVGTRT
jgi:hypothetical protein